MNKRNMDIHGIQNEETPFYTDFKEICPTFLAFIKNKILIAHNTPFDVGFINLELKKANKKPLKNPTIDSLKLSRKLFPKTKCSLDAMNARLQYPIPREKHGALLDTHILINVFAELLMKNKTSQRKHKKKIIKKTIQARKQILKPTKNKKTGPIKQKPLKKSCTIEIV